MADLGGRLRALARTETLLVSTDYDGTLAPIVDDPARALPLPECVAALEVLAELPATHVAVISGRARDDLANIGGFPDPVQLVGSHGSEFDSGFGVALDAPTRARREAIRRVIDHHHRRLPGSHVESKPAGATLHYRHCPPGDATDAVLSALRRALAELDDVSVIEGKLVIEAAAVRLDKGAALQRLRRSVGATATVFCGDDTTDEAAFAVMGGDDVAVKVGPGPTRAPFRIDDPAAVARMFRELGALRAAADASSASAD